MHGSATSSSLHINHSLLEPPSLLLRRISSLFMSSSACSHHQSFRIALRRKNLATPCFARVSRRSSSLWARRANCSSTSCSCTRGALHARTVFQPLSLCSASNICGSRLFLSTMRCPSGICAPRAANLSAASFPLTHLPPPSAVRRLASWQTEDHDLTCPAAHARGVSSQH